METALPSPTPSQTSLTQLMRGPDTDTPPCVPHATSGSDAVHVGTPRAPMSIEAFGGRSGGNPRVAARAITSAQRTSRRRLLAVAASATAAGTLGGCRVVPAAVLRALPQLPPLVVAENVLYEARETVSRAWAHAFPRRPLRVIPQPTTLVRGPNGTVLGYSFAPAKVYDHAGDVLGVDSNTGADPNMVPLGPYLKDANFSLTSLVGSSTDVFLAANGEPVALPLGLSEIQFCVNHKALRNLGIPLPVQWSLNDMKAALDLALQRGPLTRTAPLIAGLTWVDVRLWGAFVLGLGGSLPGYGKPGANVQSILRSINLSGAVAATGELLDFARRYQWAPPSSDNTIFVPASFPLRGFVGPFSNTLFAFMSPPNPGPIPSAVVKEAFLQLPASSFPLLGKRRVVPSWVTQALAVSPYSKQPRSAIDFILWLYQPTQQRMLADVGIPPVVNDQELRAYWSQARSIATGLAPAFDPDGFVDVVGELPPWGTDMPAIINYDIALIPALRRAYAGTDTAASALAAVAETFNNPTAGLAVPQP